MVVKTEKKELSAPCREPRGGVGFADEYKAITDNGAKLLSNILRLSLSDSWSPAASFPWRKDLLFWKSSGKCWHRRRCSALIAHCSRGILHPLISSSVKKKL